MLCVEIKVSYFAGKMEQMFVVLVEEEDRPTVSGANLQPIGQVGKRPATEELANPSKR
jgi:hypothetical protein